MSEQNTNFLDKRKIKVLFSIISIMLLAPPMIRHEISYYTTLFVFLAGRMVDLLVIAGKNDMSFFFIWQTFNRWGSILACAMSFSLLHPGFASLFSDYVDLVNGLMFLFPISCVLQELFALILEDVRIKTLERVVKEETFGDAKERGK